MLHIVATPIGNLADITRRAIETLRSVDLIYAEDTRHSGRLLQHLGITTTMRSLHEHNELQRVEQVLAELEAGQQVAIVSDAGTPLISDPGYRLVRAALERGCRVSPVPGASALVAAVSAAGLPTDEFLYLGFPPGKAGARRKWLQRLAGEVRTLVFYESCHRISETLLDMQHVFGADRLATVCREMTKQYETIRLATISDHVSALRNAVSSVKGEFVVVVSGLDSVTDTDDEELKRVMPILLTELPLSTAASVAAKITGTPRRQAYQFAQKLKS